MKKIGFDAKRAFCNTTGLGNYSRTIIETAVRYGKSFEFYAYSPKPKHSSFDFPFQDYSNLHIRFAPTQTKIGTALHRGWNIQKDILRDNLDVFHGLSNELPFSIHKIPVKKIVTLHDVIFARYPQGYSFWDRNIHYQKARYACRFADIIVTMSRQSEEDIIHYFPEAKGKVQVIYQTTPHAFRFFRFETEQNQSILQNYHLSKRYILYVGSITQRKNVASLVQAMVFLPEDIHLVIVGNGNLLKETLKNIEILGLSKRVSIFTNINQETLPYFYKNAFVFVYPSIYEGFGLPIQEALLSGLPVIAGENGCFPEAGGGGAIYVNQRSPKAIAEGVEALFNDPSLVKTLIKNGKLHLEQFSEEKITRQYLELYSL